MSYCRFSSDNCKSDVYVYDGSEGITIHVAASRLIGYIPKLPNILETDQEEFYDLYKKRLRAIRRCEREKIDHPLAGTTTCHKTVKEALDELEYLTYEGFYVPEFVFEDLKKFLEE